MKAYAIEVSDLRAVVELRPNWIARLFGSDVTRVTIVRKGPGYVWCTEYSVDQLTHIKHGKKILRALDFRPSRPIPRATLRSVK